MPDRIPFQPVRAFVGIGANLGEPSETFAAARQALADEPGIDDVSASSVYRTRPVGDVPQPDFWNAVLAVHTPLSALALLDTLLSIEDRFGRKRTTRWGPRTLDLDLLLYDDRVIGHPRLTVPHPELHRRGFVLVPLAELAATVRHPVRGHTIVALRDEWRREAPDAAGAVRAVAPEDAPWPVPSSREEGGRP